LNDLPFTGFESGPSHHPTALKFYGKIPTTDIYCLLKYKKGNISQRLIHQFKYKGKEELSGIFAYHQIQRFKEFGISPKWDIIVPVPLHENKLRKRGYNQSEKFAFQLSNYISIPVSGDALKRIEINKVQALLNRTNRYENVKSIYCIGNKESIANKSILLVDDVITTGATLEVCTNLLLENGAKSVSLASIATALLS
jgi:ComF family protein